MSKSTRTAAPVDAAFVRAAVAAAPEKFSHLSPEALHTAQVGQRGRLHKDVIATFNKGRKSNRKYVVGVSRQAAVAAKAEVEARRQALRDAGVEVKSRGRLPKMVLATDKV